MTGQILHAFTNQVPDGTITSIVRPSDWNSGHVFTLQDGVLIGGNTAGVTASISSGSFVLAGGNNITLSQNGNSVTVSGPHVSQFLTTAALSNHSHGDPQLNLTNLSGTTASNSAGFTLSLSAAAGGAGDGGNILAAGTRTAGSNSSVLFSNLNGITFGLDTVNGSVMTASYTVPSVTNSSWSVSDAATSGTVGRLAFTNLNGITLSLSSGTGGLHTIVGSYTVPTVTNSSWSVSDAATSGTVGRLAFTNLNGITLSLSSGTGGLHTIVGSYTVPNVTNSSWTVSDAATSGTVGRLAFTNLNGVTLSLSSGTGGLHTIVGSHNAITTADLSQNSSKYIQNWKLTGNTAGTTSSAQGTDLWFSGGNSLTISGSSNSLVFSVGNYITTAGLSQDSSKYAGTGFTTGTTTGAWTATLNTAGLSMVQPFLTRLIIPADEQLTPVTAPANASMTFRYVDIPCFITGTRIDALIGMSFSTSVGAGTQTLQQSAYCVIYTKNAASLSSLSSGSTQTTWTMASNTAGQTQLSQAAVRRVSVPVNFNMQPGEYYIGFNYITAGTAVSMTHSIYGGNDIQTASNFAEMGSTTNATTGQLWGAMGVYNAASTGMPASVSISSINQTGSALSAANIALVLRNA